MHKVPGAQTRGCRGPIDRCFRANNRQSTSTTTTSATRTTLDNMFFVHTESAEDRERLGRQPGRPTVGRLSGDRADDGRSDDGLSDGLQGPLPSYPPTLARTSTPPARHMSNIDSFIWARAAGVRVRGT